MAEPRTVREDANTLNSEQIAVHAHSIPWWGCAARSPPAHWMQNS